MKNTCGYLVWDKARTPPQLSDCGEEAGETTWTRYGSNVQNVHLCAEHESFVKDCNEGPFTRSKKLHPANYNWLAKARAAYGIKAFTMGKPSDAGKAPYKPERREIVDAWAARMPRFHTETMKPVIVEPNEEELKARVDRLTQRIAELARLIEAVA